jgi:hypothetical protein
MASIDRADWHSGADDFPDDAPEENGATHIGWFVRWAIGRGLFVPEEDMPNEMIEAVRVGTMSARDFVMKQLDGKLWPSDLSEEGLAFAEAQYEKYLDDFGDLIVALDLDSPYYAEDSEENYRKMAATLDACWTRFKRGVGTKS